MICGLSLLAVIFLKSHPANGFMTAVPRSAAVLAGKWMSMECRTTNESYMYVYVYEWTRKRPDIYASEVIFINHDGIRGLTSNNSIYFGVDMDESCSGSLYSNTTRLKDAGSYVCHIRMPGGRGIVSAHLTVLESDPNCEINVTAEDSVTLTEGDTIWMQCSVNFRGMWAPTVEWKRHTVNDREGKDDKQIVLQGVSTETVFNSRVTSTLIYVSGSSKATYMYFSCRIFFQWHDRSVSVTATNIPTYTYTWKSPMLIPHQAQLETTEEVYVATLPVEVQPLGTSTEKSSESSDWYIISLILLFAVLVLASLLVGLGIRRYVRFRRATGLDMVYNVSASSTSPLRRLEQPPSIEYNISPTAIPNNIYERIVSADADDDVTEQATTSCNNHPPLTECYSGLIDATRNATCQYENLDQYEKTDLFNPETDPATKETPEAGEAGPTTPVSKRGVAEESLSSGFSDNPQVVVDAKKSKVGVKPLCVYLPGDSEVDI